MKPGKVATRDGKAINRVRLICVHGDRVDAAMFAQIAGSLGELQYRVVAPVAGDLRRGFCVTAPAGGRIASANASIPIERTQNVRVSRSSNAYWKLKMNSLDLFLHCSRESVLVEVIVDTEAQGCVVVGRALIVVVKQFAGRVLGAKIAVALLGGAEELHCQAGFKKYPSSRSTLLWSMLCNPSSANTRPSAAV
jgi:hypothetical protein